MEMVRYPNRLKLYRKREGYSQKKVTRLLGLVDTCILSRWERGLTAPNIGYLFSLARIYHANPMELYPQLWNKDGRVDSAFYSVVVSKAESSMCIDT